MIKTTITVTSVAKSKKNENLTIVSMIDDGGNKIFQQNWGTSDLTRASEGDRFVIQGKLERKTFTGNDGKEHYADWFSGQPVCKVGKIEKR